MPELTDGFVLDMTRSQARTEQMLTDMNSRLFGGPGQEGVLPYMIGESKKVEARVVALETTKTGVAKWVGGVVAVLTLEGTALGIYFSRVAAHVQAIQQTLKH